MRVYGNIASKAMRRCFGIIKPDDVWERLGTISMREAILGIDAMRPASLHYFEIVGGDRIVTDFIPAEMEVKHCSPVFDFWIGIPPGPGPGPPVPAPAAAPSDIPDGDPRGGGADPCGAAAVGDDASPEDPPGNIEPSDWEQKVNAAMELWELEVGVLGQLPEVALASKTTFVNIIKQKTWELGERNEETERDNEIIERTKEAA